jgi:hypothetical protein
MAQDCRTTPQDIWEYRGRKAVTAWQWVWDDFQGLEKLSEIVAI